ncbi:MAG: hypothetical protein P0Y49_18955 [Candidatus Pedobacter colombiensis]|uniref:Uncharacterized protein n=1 Tax=Candidatus Pedobacter colombiensis TaxID=3121371 RepID=A0AAJ6B885_9SPHI|nr:hypothetical protein [Pedobacter sp.]WEK18858.1 MAG: hypothetical protein P0Y49_18955 [Pedobacter sp.]
MNLADAFGEEAKREFAQNCIVVGKVIKCFVEDTNPPKEKRFIIVGISNDNSIKLATVYINSHVNHNVFPTPELQALHLNLECANRPYLSYDSHVDCSQLKKKNKDWLINLIAEDPTRVLGEVAPTDFAIIKETLKGTTTISVADKKRYGLF